MKCQAGIPVLSNPYFQIRHLEYRNVFMWVFLPEDVWKECAAIQGGGVDAKGRVGRALAVDGKVDGDRVDVHVDVGRDHITGPEGGAVTVK